MIITARPPKTTLEHELMHLKKIALDESRNLREQVEQLQVQLAGCLTAAEGVGTDSLAKQGITDGHLRIRRLLICGHRWSG